MNEETGLEKKGCCTPQSGRQVQREPVTVAAGASPVESARAMVELPGGTFLMGTNYKHGFPADGEGPVRPVTLGAFAIDTYSVTNADFAEFVRATGYRTEAEAFGWSFVFWAHLPEDRFEELVEDTVAAAPWWCKVSGAKWDAPEGPGSDVTTRGKHPVVQVSWNDAAAYAAWAGKTLPTEAQWEYAARGGLEQKLFPWGDVLMPEGRHLCNVWQGKFPQEDTAEDGFAGSCPVDSFPANGYGISSMTGNVWEWCGDWFGTDFGKALTVDPVGPESGAGKVMKGGSFLCHASYCNRYRVAARTLNTPDSSTSNIGFRCVKVAV